VSVRRVVALRVESDSTVAHRVLVCLLWSPSFL